MAEWREKGLQNNIHSTWFSIGLSNAFNAESYYKLCYHINSSMRVMCIDNDIDAYRNISCIDITYHMSIIREIFRYIGSLYFNNKTTRWIISGGFIFCNFILIKSYKECLLWVVWAKYINSNWNKLN